jgi:hypothetical protein
MSGIVGYEDASVREVASPEGTRIGLALSFVPSRPS